MTVKHTPGPWVDGLDASGIVVVERISAQTVVSLGGISEVSIANAKLIGAAPALADGLEEAAKQCAALHGAKYGEHNCRTCTRWLFALNAAGRLP
jgi:hypothetical protein